MERLDLPYQQGLYNPEMEKDSCGVGFIANINGSKCNSILTQGLQILKSLKHRGAVGADASTGDGSGVLLQIPHAFLRDEALKLGIRLPEAGDYAVGMIFLPRQPNARNYCEGLVERVLREENQTLLGWREVPVNPYACGESARATRPVVIQIFIERGEQSEADFNRKLLVVRKRVQGIINEGKKPYTESFYFCSLSNKTIIYKGQIFGYMLEEFYLDLQDKRVETAIALVHERYSTNTFPSWKLAQPFRYVAHNGEINTIRGNINWMRAREGVMRSAVFGEDFEKILPIIEAGGSDSASFDNAFELFTVNNHSVENVMMMLIPEAWQRDTEMDEEKRGFYEYHARVMEPWDGPATIAFTDGEKIGVTVDRNGLRPARYVITKDGLIIMASEIGVVDIAPEDIAEKGNLKPGKLLMVDTKEGRIISDTELKDRAIKRKPFAQWVERNRITLADIETAREQRRINPEGLYQKQLIFGYTEEELERVIAYMADNAKEPIGSMGIDIPLAVLSRRPQLLFNYFKQKFAQVTNPPIDPIREESIMSLIQFIGSHGRLLDEIEIERENKYIMLEHPILYNHQLEDMKNLYNDDFKAISIPMVFQSDHSENGVKEALGYLCKRAEESIKLGYNIIILSDRSVDMYNAPIPSLLALSAVHQHLVKNRLRTAVDLVVEAGDARDVMHLALLVGYGAKAVNPYMAFESIAGMYDRKKHVTKVSSLKEAYQNYVETIASGLLKIISRMGISTLQSYCGAQIFEAIGMDSDVIDEYFTGTPNVLSGIGLEEIASEVLIRHIAAYHQFLKLEVGGEISWNSGGEYHIFNPAAVQKLQKASKDGDLEKYTAFAQEINQQNETRATIRGMLRLRKGNPIPLEEVEAAEDIIKRFRISAMSFGSISAEAHEALAIAMNRIGGASNCGEGGEDPNRFIKTTGDSPRSAVKQVASGRFGVTANYLVNCDEIEIKIAQGAKPGEGGHLPGNKVTPEIARVRHSAPEIDLISPPPHHDIYSIEDLSQLVFDLKNVNPKAKIGVKLVAQLGVGTVAAGVVKAHADTILISGHDGGTGASPISSMKYVGLPWEIGLAEAQQTLLLNDLRSRVTLQVDGKLLTGRDIVIAALLGAEIYGFASAALIAIGCKMCRQCHLNRCPVGIATQDQGLRKRFNGSPEALINYLNFVAEEARIIMSELGFRKIDEMIGKVELLEGGEVDNSKLKNCDFASILYKPELPSRVIGKYSYPQDHMIEDVLDRRLIRESSHALEKGEAVQHYLNIKNTDRSFGAMLSGEIALRYGEQGLPEDTIEVYLQGSAGQSFGAFAAGGLSMYLEGDSNDYLGKGLSGGKIVLVPPKAAVFNPSENIIAGNTILYGATAGEVYIQGRVGQRFCVRNSGASAVVEGVGDHGCEYMTGGTVVILGAIGKNFGAGMSGGIAYVLEETRELEGKLNKELVNVEVLSKARDIAEVKELLTKHYNYTRSPKAAVILENWSLYQNKFFKICSPAYERLLDKIV